MTRPAHDLVLNTQARRRLAADIRASEPYCHLCGYPISLDLDRQRHPLASCIDEIIPRSQGGSAIDRANTAHAHALCNGSRGTKPITAEVRARCRELVAAHLAQSQTGTTSRDW